MQIRLPAAGLLALSLTASAAFAQDERAARIDAIFAAYAKDSSPGCAVAVYEGDRIVHRSAYGMANLDHDVRLTPSSVFHVASVSKQFTAAAILLLAQDGRLSVDDDVRKHLPELPDFGTAITLRQLANHTSGMRDQWDLLGLAGWRYSRDLITDDDVMELLTRQQALNFEPGDRHLYSNSGYTLLAQVVTRASGQSLREFTRARIFEPLGMTNTHFRDDFREVVKNQAYGYQPSDGGFRLSVTNFDTVGATSLLTTVEDLAKWHANFDTHVVGGEPFQKALLEPGVLKSGRRLDYAFGVTHGTHRGLPTVGHGGSDAGYRAHFFRFPDRKLGVATLCNISSANPARLSQQVADLFLPADLATADGEPRDDDTPEVAVPAGTLARLAGFYWRKEDAASRTVALDGGRLHVVSGRGRTPLKSLGDGVFVARERAGERMTFRMSAEATTMTLAEGAEPFVKAAPFTPTAGQMAEFAGAYRSEEMDAVFRIAAHEGALRLERSKFPPAPLVTLLADTFRAQPGVLQFTRDAQGQVDGFLLEGGRIKRVRFWKDRPTPTSSSAPR